MEIYGDYHVHSNYSDGRQTVEDIIKAARQQGLHEVAITDHGPRATVIGVKNEGVYLELRDIIDEINAAGNEPKVLLGAEANIRDRSGTLDISEEVIEKLDILIAGLHPYTLPTSIGEGVGLFVQNSLRHLSPTQQQKAINANTKAVVEAIYQNPQLDILAHPGLFFTVDIEEVAQACMKNNVLFEINCGHEFPEISDIMKADRIGVDFIINSDAHFKETVGTLEYGVRAIQKLEIDEARIVNLADIRGYSGWSKKVRDCRYS